MRLILETSVPLEHTKWIWKSKSQELCKNCNNVTQQNTDIHIANAITQGRKINVVIELWTGQYLSLGQYQHKYCHGPAWEILYGYIWWNWAKSIAVNPFSPGQMRLLVLNGMQINFLDKSISFYSKFIETYSTGCNRQRVSTVFSNDE